MGGKMLGRRQIVHSGAADDKHVPCGLSCSSAPREWRIPFHQILSGRSYRTSKWKQSTHMCLSKSADWFIFIGYDKLCEVSVPVIYSWFTCIWRTHILTL